MTKRAPTFSPLAGTAIAAVLALSATPGAAQEAPAADPVIVQQAAPAAEPAPAPVAAPVLTSEPIVQAVPETPVAVAAEDAAPVASAKTAQERGSVRTPVQRTSAAPAAESAAPASAAPAAAASDTGTAVTIPQIADQAPAPAPLPAEPAPAADATAPLSEGAGLGLGLLGLAALGGIGFAATRRRRVNVTPAPERPALGARAATPVRQRELAMASPAAGIAAAPALINREEQPKVSYDRVAPSPARTAMTGTAGSTIPSGPLPTGEAAVALFNRLANAAPDDANPFTSVKRRRKRTRWLLKQHEYALRRNATQPFDYRTYEPSAKPLDTVGSQPALQPA